MSHKVFLSHNSADKPAVETLARRLLAVAEKDIEPWLDKWNLIPGQPWQEGIEDAMNECHACVIFIGRHDTGNGVLGPWQNAEMRALINRQVTEHGKHFPVIPVLLPGAERGQRSALPTFLVANTWVEFRNTLDDPEAFARLVAGIRRQTLLPESNGQVILGECPYLGLEFFDIRQAGQFFGREAVTQWLVDDIRKTLRPGSDLPRFLAILGASGSGKSSVARAGLYAAIQGGAIEGSRDWIYVPPIRPGPKPIESLELAIIQAAAGSPLLGVVREELCELGEKPDRLHRAARLLVTDASSPRRLFLLIDQFEEIFTMCERDAERDAFVAALLYAARERGGPVVVAITMRADFAGKVAALEQLARVLAQHQYLLGPMEKAELELAIEEPARRAGAEFDPGLVDVLIDDVDRQPGALTLLQHALLELWNRREGGRRLTHAAYEDVGKLQGALEKRANEVFESFDLHDQKRFRQIFLSLVNLGEGSEDTRRRVKLSELLAKDHARTTKILETLTAKDSRLVVTTGALGGDSFVEVAHETIIRSWPRLREWLDADRTDLRMHRRLIEDVEQWSSQHCDKSYLLRGARLVETTAWARLPSEPLSKKEVSFLIYSEIEEGRASFEWLSKFTFFNELETALRYLLASPTASERKKGIAALPLLADAVLIDDLRKYMLQRIVTDSSEQVRRQAARNLSESGHGSWLIERLNETPHSGESFRRIQMAVAHFRNVEKEGCKILPFLPRDKRRRLMLWAAGDLLRTHLGLFAAVFSTVYLTGYCLNIVLSVTLRPLINWIKELLPESLQFLNNTWKTIIDGWNAQFSTLELSVMAVTCLFVTTRAAIDGSPLNKRSVRNACFWILALLTTPIFIANFSTPLLFNQKVEWHNAYWAVKPVITLCIQLPLISLAGLYFSLPTDIPLKRSEFVWRAVRISFLVACTSTLFDVFTPNWNSLHEYISADNLLVLIFIAVGACVVSALTTALSFLLALMAFRAAVRVIQSPGDFPDDLFA